MLDELKARAARGRDAGRAAVFQLLPGRVGGQPSALFDGESGAAVTTFELPRQEREGGVCLADFVQPLERGGPRTTCALFVVTAGEGIRELAEQLQGARATS